jgi:benzoate membrane transport protein
MTMPVSHALRDLSPSAVVAGFVAVLVGFTSSVAIVFAAAQALGATAAQTTSWIWALGLGMGLTSIGLSLAYRQPVLTAWSTPGAALLAGVLARFALDAVGAVPQAPALVLGMTAAYLVGWRGWPRYAVPGVLVVGIAIAAAQGRLRLDALEWAWAVPVWTTPVFSASALVGVALPLFVVTMASQNLPGVAAQRASGCDAPVSPVITTTGLATLALAPFGGYALNLAAITAAICMGREAHEDPARRYMAAVAAGVFYVALGLAAARSSACWRRCRANSSSPSPGSRCWARSPPASRPR